MTEHQDDRDKKTNEPAPPTQELEEALEALARSDQKTKERFKEFIQ